jgi:hypothetical protein
MRFLWGAAGEARLGVGMLGPERLLADRQSELEERPRSGEIALGLQQARELVEAGRDQRVTVGSYPNGGWRDRLGGCSLIT